MLITPFMSCSARLPIYILFVGTFFPDHGGLVLFGLYLLGIALAVVTARLMRRFLYKVDETPFVMELPPYRMPTMRATLSHMWDKSAQYLRKMGGLILVASLFVWFLSYFPRPVAGEPEIEHYENSYLGQLGRWCEPAVEPLGLNWKAGVAILSGVSARRSSSSTLGVLYSQDATADDASLAQTLRESGDFTPASALAFLVFVLLYFPCIATIVAVRNEAGRGWALASMVYSTARGMVRGLDRLSHRLVVVNELAGYSGCARRRRAGVDRRPEALLPRAGTLSGGCASCERNCPLHDLKSSDKKGRS